MIDQNDNAPTFGQDSYNAPSDVCECSDKGSVVATMTAEDKDESSINQISYRLVDANVTFAPYVPAHLLPTDPKTLFMVDRATGEVKVASNTLASLIGNYTLLIEAADQGGLTARTLLHFNVTSDNKFSPEFTVPQAIWENGTSLVENSPAETRIFQVTATDKDTFGSNGQIEFYFYDNSSDSLVSELPLGLRINKNSGIIYSTRPFDAEVDPAVIPLKIVAQDKGTPPRMTNGTLNLHIIDVDEFAPRWMISPIDGCNMQFNFWIPEHSPIGGRVGRLWSLDDDRTNRSYFRLEPRNDAKYFSVNPLTGVVTIAKPSDDEDNSGKKDDAAEFLDYEDKEHRDFVLFVTVSPLASDGQADATSTTPSAMSSSQTVLPVGCLRGGVARVYIHLRNMEDDRPVFNRPNKPYYYCVAADAVKNTLVSYLPPMTASDNDGSKLTFRMSSSEWRSSAGFVSVTCAFRMQTDQHGTTQPANAQLVVNSAIGNYSRSYFRVPIDVRDQSGLSSATTAYVWVTPPENSSPMSHNLMPTSEDEVIIPPAPSEQSSTYVTVTVADKYDVFMSKLATWVDCVSETLLAGDRFFAGAPLCVASVAPSTNDPSLTVVRIAAASKSDMLLAPSVLFVEALQKQINATGGGVCGVIGAVCPGCSGAINVPLVSTIVAGRSGFDALALLIALAVILLFLILLLLILLAICCRTRRKAPILIPAPPPPPTVPVFAVKPARLYETQEAYMTVDQDQGRDFEEQEVRLDECEEDEEEVFEIPLPREYETQTVLLDMPQWAREYGYDNAAMALEQEEQDYCEPGQLTLTQQHAGKHLSGSVYSEPYFKSSHVEQRAFSMLHIDTKPGPVLGAPIARGSQQINQQPPSSRRVTHSSSNERQTVLLQSSSVVAPRTPSLSPDRGSRSSSPGIPNLPGGKGHISRRLDNRTPSPSAARSHQHLHQPTPQRPHQHNHQHAPRSSHHHVHPQQPQQSQSPSQQPFFGTEPQQQQAPQHHHHHHHPPASHHHHHHLQEVPSEPRQFQPRESPRPVNDGLLRPAISADSITLLSREQQARRAALHQQQDNEQPEMRMGGRTDESEPSEGDESLRRRQMEDDDVRGNGRLRRSRSLPKYLQPPAELQSVMAELHDYIKSPEQKARRRRISQKYRAKILASGGGAALQSNQAGQTSSSGDSVDGDQSQQQSSGHQGQQRQQQQQQQQQPQEQQQQQQQGGYMML